METFVVEIAGEPVMAFRAENEEEAQELVNGDDSERGGIKTVLAEYSREDGKPLWDDRNSQCELLRRPSIMNGRNSGTLPSKATTTPTISTPSSSRSLIRTKMRTTTVSPPDPHLPSAATARSWRRGFLICEIP